MAMQDIGVVDFYFYFFLKPKKHNDEQLMETNQKSSFKRLIAI